MSRDLLVTARCPFSLFPLYNYFVIAYVKSRAVTTFYSHALNNGEDVTLETVINNLICYVIALESSATWSKAMVR